jgi:hypothetical protein
VHLVTHEQVLGDTEGGVGWPASLTKCTLLDPALIPHHAAAHPTRTYASDVCVLSQVKGRQVWGDLTYTGDSDLVAVLMHMGYYTPSLSHTPQVRTVVPPSTYG